MAENRRAWKLQEFVAHGDNVNCLGIGHKSGRVMATGGEDKKVNMWTVGKPNCIMSLSGHTSPVEAVRFGNAEEVVVAGSMSGALKIWDLEAAKIIRTLTGHTANIRSLDFHPYGDFVASGSLDTNIKLWDIRRKGCIFTYKGHTNCVNTLRFSPDGRWIASAGQDGLLKLWDLTAGKLLNDFTHHDGPVTCAEFHPSEFLLTSGSADRTVKFWDLETFQLVSSTEGEASGVRCILYHPEGKCVYSGSQDQMRVYGWEPACCYDSVSMSWGKIADMAIAHSQLIGATFHQCNVSTFVVDIEQIQPVGGSPESARYLPSSSSGRRSFIGTERPHTQSSTQAPKEEPEQDSPLTYDPGADNLSVADIHNADDYNDIFRPKHTLARGNVISPATAATSVPAVRQNITQQTTQSRVSPVSRPATQSTTSRTSATSSASSRGGSGAPPAPQPSGPPQPTRTATTRPSATPQATPLSQQPPPTSHQKQQPQYNSPHPAPTTNHSEPATSAMKNNGAIDDKKLHNKPAEINVDEFVVKPPAAVSEMEALTSIEKGHHSMTTVLSARQKNLQIVRALYTGGNMKNAIDSAVGMGDQAVIVDILEILVQRKSLWTLDICSLLLPKIKDLLESKYENYRKGGARGLRVLLKNFASVIKNNIAAPPSSGVDISREERYNKCKHCYNLLMDIRTHLNQTHNIPQQREIQLLMSQLD